jgi:hypothetical protein
MVFQANTHDVVGIIQSPTFGGNKGKAFNDLETVYNIDMQHPIQSIVIMSGDVIDGINVKYWRAGSSAPGVTTTRSHGTSLAAEAANRQMVPAVNKTIINIAANENIIGVSGLYGTGEFGTRAAVIKMVPADTVKKTIINIAANENIIGVSGLYGTGEFGTRVAQLNFVIYNSDTGGLRVENLIGDGKVQSPQSFVVTANGILVAFGGFADDIDSSVSLGDAHIAPDDTDRGGLYGLNFLEMAYRSV